MTQPSLCLSCLYMQIVKGRHEQTYLLCRNESIKEKYPRQPVITCLGHRPAHPDKPYERE